MEVKDNIETKAGENGPLEMPEVVPGVASVDYPEINEFLQKMKIKTALFGYQKEDALEKMQQLNNMYQSRAQQMRDQVRGQLKQMKKQQQEDVIELRGHLQRAQDEFKEECQKEIEDLKTEHETKMELLRNEYNKELEEENS